MARHKPASARTIYRTSVCTAATCLPLSLLTLATWGLRLYPQLGLRPNLVLMVYMATLLVGTVALGLAIIVRLHSTIGDAFAQGYKIAHAELRLGFTPPQLDQQPPKLRAVE